MNCLLPLSQTNTKIQVIMAEITTIQTFLEAVVKAELVVGYLVRSRKWVKFDGETLVPGWTLLNSKTPFDCWTVLDGQTVWAVDTLDATVAV